MKGLKYPSQNGNNLGDISHPQNCALIESLHSQWPKTTTETVGSTTIKHHHHQQQIWMIDNEPSMPIYSFSSIGRPPSRTFPSHLLEGIL